MSDKLVKFRKLAQVFDPIYRPYEDAEDGPGGSYVPEAHEDYRKNLSATLELNDSVKLLLAGQPGCGKTTLLLNVTQHLRRQGRLVAFVDLEGQAAVQDLSSIELHLAVIVELLLETQKRSIPLSLDIVKRVHNWMERLQGGKGADAQVPALTTALRFLLSSVRDSKALRDELRMQVKVIGEDPVDVLAMILRDVDAHRPIVVVDGMDKLPPEQARDRFLTDGKKPLVDVPAAAVVTIPISLVYESTFNVLSERYNNADSAVLPAVRLYDFDHGRQKRVLSDNGLVILRRIVAARVNPIDPDIIAPEAVDRALTGSGGNIRELARLLQSSVVKAHVRQGQTIEEADVSAAIADRRESFRRAYNPAFRQVLEKVHREYRLEGPGDVRRQLLYGLWVMEYRNGEAWYSLPDPVEQLLRRLGSSDE
jgi:energy-coupling factor transporter ATP-binding protein EcfA2